MQRSSNGRVSGIDTNRGARQRTHPAERHDEQKLVPERLVDIGGDFDLHGCAFEDSPQ
jgi:hypothetical protein